MTVQRKSMSYDVVIVGAGPAGLSAAIRLKQLERRAQRCRAWKRARKSARISCRARCSTHRGWTRCCPDWRELDAPVTVPVTSDNFYMLGEAGKLRIPNAVMPPLMSNHGNYIVSMGNVCRWLAEQAEALGVEIFPGFACSEIVYDEDGSVKGVVAGEFGKNRRWHAGTGL